MVEIVDGVMEARIISVVRFCNELRGAILAPARDDESADGEELWKLFEALCQYYPINGKVCVMLPRETVDEVVATVEELLRRAEIIHCGEGFKELGERLKSVPPALAHVS